MIPHDNYMHNILDKFSGIVIFFIVYAFSDADMAEAGYAASEVSSG